jgi:hypothetical protein
MSASMLPWAAQSSRIKDMASFYQGTVAEFLAQTDEHVLALLSVAYANRGFTSQYSDQTLTWARDISALRDTLKRCLDDLDSAKFWGLLLEFSIPRKELRIDAVLLVGDVIIILEAKSGDAVSQAKRQIEEYALLLHYFHKGSTDRRIVPVIVTPEAAKVNLDDFNQRGLFPQLFTYWISNVLHASWRDLKALFLTIANSSAAQQALPEEWDKSAYFPVPSIMEAAVALKSGLSIREIAHSEASEHEISTVRDAIQGYVGRARAESRHVICFLTGVPGSGKTLVGLSLAHSDANKNEAVHFMSGNGPLVKVLQHLFTRESMRSGAFAAQARTEAKTLIENVHVFAKYHTEDNPDAPSNHAIIFDEAQRAWNRTQNKRKFKRDYSEPEMLLRIMGRHADWAVVVALVGGGQEINDGEAGLEEWGRAIAGSNRVWTVYASPEVLEGGASTAGHHLFDDVTLAEKVETNASLHLRTSNRSLRADRLAMWVNHLLDGDAEAAASLHVTEKFPVFLSRSLERTRSLLTARGIGANRHGLVGSSGAARLRAEGLEPSSTFHADYPWEHWYLAEETDIRSSFRCEIFATEFEIQGLELDWVGLCWGGDFIWNGLKGWQLRALRHGPQSKWTTIKSADKQIYRRNAYRVLLTRARQGMVIFVPEGDANDSTNLPADFDSTAQYLLSCGVTEIVGNVVY